MLASDSDSDLEYPAGANDSDASSDSGLKGKLAFAIDPQETKSYDGKSAPTNGSQYLMMVIREKKVTPKIARADTSKFPKRKSQDKTDNCQSTSFLDKFLQVCNINAGEDDKALSKVLPSTKWREDIVSSFSVVRARVERWQCKIETGELRSLQTPKLPESDDNSEWWLKFCYGKAFTKLAASHQKKSVKEKLSDFFLDLHDESSVKEILTDNEYTTISSILLNKESKVVDVGDSVETQSNSSTSSGSDNTAEVKSDDSFSQTLLGNRPVMNILLRLTQPQIEKLIKWNLLWLNNIGFINECQGQWIYALLASISKPIDPSVMADMRDIARYLMKARESDSWISMLEQQKESDGNEKLFDFVNSLNLLIYIVSDYFQQKDLVMKL